MGTNYCVLATEVMYSIWKPFWHHWSLSQKTKLYIYNASLTSVLLYGAETWLLYKTLAKTIDNFDRRTIESIKWWYHHISNKELRVYTHQPTASHLIMIICCMHWFKHVPCLPLDDHTRALLSFCAAALGWKRTHGRPHTRWMDVIGDF